MDESRKPEFKVGDKVRIVRAGDFPSTSEGQIGVVYEIVYDPFGPDLAPFFLYRVSVPNPDPQWDDLFDGDGLFELEE